MLPYQCPWPDLQVGEVLRKGTSFRVVRRIHYGGGERLWCWFTIKHCSWTRRCYTLYTTHELVNLGYVRTRIKVRFKTELDLRIQREIEQDSDIPRIGCCEVRGVD